MNGSGSRSIASICEIMALEVNREEPSAFSLSMVALQGVSGESLEAIDSLQALDVVAYDESIASAFNASVWQNKKQKRPGKFPAPPIVSA